MTTPNTQSFVDILALRRECWLKSYGYQNKATDDASYAKSWLGFGAFIGVATPAYALMARSTGTTNGVSSLLTGLLATAGIATYSVYYKWQSKRYMKLSHQWRDLYNSASEAETIMKKDPKGKGVLDPVLEKKKQIEMECNELTDGNIFHGTAKEYLKVMEPNNELFKHWLDKGFWGK
jgi:hypothetical protein